MANLLPPTTKTEMIRVSTAAFMFTVVSMAAAAKSVKTAKARPAINPHLLISHAIASSNQLMANYAKHLKPLARRRYDQLARFYDLIEGAMEFFVGDKWRSRLSSLVSGERVLEVGVGTGRNIPYYQAGKEYIAVDLSPNMLKRAVKKGSQKGNEVVFLVMDIERLAFKDNVFDTVLASFTFCSVANPVKGLQELRRVCKPDGKLLMLEHVRPRGRLLGGIFDMLNPLMLWAIADNINRDTISHIEKAGWKIKYCTPLASNIIFLVQAVPHVF